MKFVLLIFAVIRALESLMEYRLKTDIKSADELIKKSESLRESVTRRMAFWSSKGSLIPEGIHYTSDHHWIRIPRVEQRVALIGITFHGQELLGTIESLQLPEPGEHIWQFSQIGSMDSRENTRPLIAAKRSTTPLRAPLSGEVLAVNNYPELVNTDPYREGWLVRILLTDIYDMELHLLMSAEQYEEHTMKLDESR